MNQAAQSFLYLSKGRVLLVGNALDNGSHSHHALQITLSLEDRPFVIKHPEGEQEAHCSLVMPNYEHQVDITDSWRLLILLDGNTEDARRIEARFLQNSSVASPSEEDIAYCKDRLKDFAHEERPIDEASDAIDDVIDRLAGTTSSERSFDIRILKALAIIHQAKGQNITADQLADRLHISRDRLSHLFAEQVGIPIRSYVVWYRLSITGFKLFNNPSLAEAATEAGFSDAAHFSRTFRKMFGMTPSQIMRQTPNIKLIPDSEFLAETI